MHDAQDACSVRRFKMPGCGMPQVHQIYGYEVFATLGYGARSTIYAVRDKQRTVYALKRVVKSSPNDQRFIDQAVREYEVASQFDSPRLRRIHRLIRHRNFIRTAEVLVVMEMIDGLALEQHQPADLLDLCDICKQAAEGLQTMHEAGYVHADIKPNNIMVVDGHQAKLIDFGQSCPTGMIKERIQGTPDYIAPEQVLRRAITPTTDVFNLGATIYWLLTRKHVPTMMPRGKGEAAVGLRTEKRCDPPSTLNAAVPPALNSLVMDMIETEPRRRPQTMQEVVQRIDIAINQLARSKGEEKSSISDQRSAG